MYVSRLIIPKNFEIESCGMHVNDKYSFSPQKGKYNFQFSKKNRYIWNTNCHS